MSASSSAMRTRCGAGASGSVVEPVINDILSWTTLIIDCGVMSRDDRTHPLWWEAVASRPSYPNWQRKRIQNPSSVSSNLTEGTKSVKGQAQVPAQPPASLLADREQHLPVRGRDMAGAGHTPCRPKNGNATAGSNASAAKADLSGQAIARGRRAEGALSDRGRHAHRPVRQAAL